MLGLDLDFAYNLNRNWDVTGAYSFINKDIYRNLNGIRDIAVNAPKNKFSLCLNYSEQVSGFRSRLRFRFVEGFPVNSGVFIGKVDSFGILDLDGGIDLPGESGIRLTLTIQNLLDNKHREFVGAPEIGRLVHMQVKFYLDKYK